MISSYISCNFRNNVIATISTSSFCIDDISMLRLEQHRHQGWVYLLCVVGAAAVYSRANHNHDLHNSMHRQALICKKSYCRSNGVQGHSIISLLFSMQDCSGTVGTEYGIIGYRICWSISCSSSSKYSSQFLGVTYTPMCLFSYKLLWHK